VGIGLFLLLLNGRKPVLEIAPSRLLSLTPAGP